MKSLRQAVRSGLWIALSHLKAARTRIWLDRLAEAPAITVGTQPTHRRHEAQAALAVLGVAPEQIHFLDLPDGGLPDLEPESRRMAVEKLRHDRSWRVRLAV